MILTLSITGIYGLLWFPFIGNQIHHLLFHIIEDLSDHHENLGLYVLGLTVFTITIFLLLTPLSYLFLLDACLVYLIGRKLFDYKREH